MEPIIEVSSWARSREEQDRLAPRCHDVSVFLSDLNLILLAGGSSLVDGP